MQKISKEKFTAEFFAACEEVVGNIEMLNSKSPVVKLGLDNLDAIDIVMRLEKRLSIAIQDEDEMLDYYQGTISEYIDKLMLLIKNK